MIPRIEHLFRERFGSPSELLIVRSPGRVNLIGEHTDYNEGFVLPAAIDRAVIVAAAAREDMRCRIFAADVNETFECVLPDIHRSDRGWPNYVLGVIDQFLKAGASLRGCDFVFGGNLPIGAGLSSSAAVEGGIAFALDYLFSLGYDRRALAQLGQRAENEFVGVNCGIMDQYVNMLGKPGHALRIDCRTLTSEDVPLTDPRVRVVLCETPARRALASSEYNIRRRQCEEGVRSLRRAEPNLKSLRDVSREMLEAHGTLLDPVVLRRCKHVVHENERVLLGCGDLIRNDLSAFGRRMFESHESLQHNYEVSSAELDLLVDFARTETGVYGGRMMGAGFGGCTINLVEADAVPSFQKSIVERFRRATGHQIRVFEASISEGTARYIDTTSQTKQQIAEGR